LRPIILSGIRSYLVAFVVFGLVNLPVMAATEKPLGMVVTASHAQLDRADAATGADVYSGDAVATESDGSIRLQVGASQVYLLASSSATLAPQGDKMRANVARGTVGFSSANQLEIETPLGTVASANGQRVLGQVTILNAKSIRVSAFEGALLVRSADGQEKTIEQGQTYQGDLLPATTTGGSGNGSGTINVGGKGINWWHVGLAVGVGVVLAIGSWRLWHYEEESCSDLSCRRAS